MLLKILSNSNINFKTVFLTWIPDVKNIVTLEFLESASASFL